MIQPGIPPGFAPGIALLLASLAASPAMEHGQELFVRHCLECHRSNCPSQVDLAEQGSRKRRALTAAAVVRDGLMPPWLPGEESAPLLGNRRLSQEDRATLAQWLLRGAIVEGELPARPPSPDADARLHLASSPQWRVGADPGMAMRSFAIELNNPQPLRLRGLALTCDSPGLVQSISLLADTRGYARRLDAGDPLPGYDAAGDIGLRASGSDGAVARLDGKWLLPRGCAVELPTQSVLILEVHADPRGRLESTACAVDLLPAEPGARRVVAHSFSRLRSALVSIPSQAVAILVRAGSNARMIRVIASAPDRSRRVLLEIPQWNERFSEPWTFDQPVPLASQTELTVEWSINPEAPTTPPTSHAGAMVEPTVVLLTLPEASDSAQAIVTFGSR